MAEDKQAPKGKKSQEITDIPEERSQDLEENGAKATPAKKTEGAKKKAVKKSHRVRPLKKTGQNQKIQKKQLIQ